MTLMRWSPSLNPARDLAGVHDEVNRLFDDFLNRGAWRRDVPAIFTPAVDIEETADAFVLRADLPGVAQNDVKVSLLGDTLTLRGERKSEKVQKDGNNYHRVERTSGSFERSFSFGTAVRSEGVKAQYKDGVLEIHVPKAEEAKLREIQVQIS
jgi:HSP20 family protein